MTLSGKSQIACSTVTLSGLARSFRAFSTRSALLGLQAVAYADKNDALPQLRNPVIGGADFDIGCVAVADPCKFAEDQVVGNALSSSEGDWVHFPSRTFSGRRVRTTRANSTFSVIKRRGPDSTVALTGGPPKTKSNRASGTAFRDLPQALRNLAMSSCRGKSCQVRFQQPVDPFYCGFDCNSASSIPSQEPAAPGEK